MTEELPEIPGFRYARPLGKNVHLYRGSDGEVAVKLLVDPPRAAEIRTVAALGHPGIVSVDRAGRTRAGLPYLVMRYFPDGDLAAAAPLPFGRVLEIGIGVADALHAAHQAGVVHRDVKPANVLRDAHGQVYLTDFGTTGGDHLLWSAPEVISSGAHSVRADVFSLGVILWEALTLRRLFPTSSEVDARARMHATPVPPRKCPAGVECGQARAGGEGVHHERPAGTGDR